MGVDCPAGRRGLYFLPGDGRKRYHPHRHFCGGMQGHSPETGVKIHFLRDACRLSGHRGPFGDGNLRGYQPDPGLWPGPGGNHHLYRRAGGGGDPLYPWNGASQCPFLHVFHADCAGGLYLV